MAPKRGPDAPKKSAEELADDIFEKKEKEEETQKIQRRLAYLAIQWTLQILCAVLVTFAVFWAAVQLMGLFNVFGISNLPPGVRFAPELN